MYDRMLIPPKNKSFFLFGPRGTGKSYWVKATFPNSVYLDLLEAELYIPLMANPQRLQEFIGKTTKQQWIIVDEVQKIPELLNEVHRLIEKNHYKFILTGSSARKLKKKGVNLLAGRALTYHLYPLTSSELGKDFVLNQSIQFGHLPSVFSEENPKKYLQSYIQTYLKEEIQQEGLTRNLGAFLRFLEAASFSQGSTINIAEVARECSVHRKVVEQYFVILEDLLLAKFLPVFTKRSKRRLLAHPKFYYFDVGIYRALRPRGPLDRSEEIDGHALETLFFQELTALNDYMQTDGQIYYWKTASQIEVDFVWYGNSNIYAFEIKRENKVSSESLKGLKAFLKDYPQAQAFLVYCGDKVMIQDDIQILPFQIAINKLPQLLAQ